MFRHDYTDTQLRTYKLNHEKQTIDFVLSQKKKYGHHTFNDIWYQIEKRLDTIVDESDPDTELSQLQHALQSAEAARKLCPHLDWIHLVALIHDLGKLLISYGEPQWAVVGDTFPVGHPRSDKIVFHELFIIINEPSIYKEHCGFDNVHMSWGHDEYLYQTLKNNKNTRLPEIGLYIIRYHSFYPWHKDGAYSELASEKDQEYLPWMQLFSRLDLYSKADEPIQLTDELKTYYQNLIKKYLE